MNQSRDNEESGWLWKRSSTILHTWYSGSTFISITDASLGVSHLPHSLHLSRENTQLEFRNSKFQASGDVCVDIMCVRVIPIFYSNIYMPLLMLLTCCVAVCFRSVFVKSIRRHIYMSSNAKRALLRAILTKIFLFQFLI